MALVKASRALRAVSVFWSFPGRYEAVVTATGRIIYRQLPEMIRVPFPTEGELAKAVAQTRAARSAAEESSRRESGC
ncbi:hypothetical protein HD597_006829 [Nonomuraea thailandensis]|uniref:Uncharacterized protein n=1 Tax=Nonomuraea thailandensis TaxID=1188745 RepID=A0A9X2GLH5_9ACTN|nr:hypothetical protein [Nonomuraea thailandensis]MCP2359809.1 hypothetical protein [Nonomuraea thailandensis]